LQQCDAAQDRGNALLPCHSRSSGFVVLLNRPPI
jgi:hypothetical protein